MKTCINCNKSKAEDEYEPKRRKCKTCRADDAKKYYEKNRDKMKERNKKWRENNRGKRRVAQRRYVAKHPNYIKEWRKKNHKKNSTTSKRWKKSNPEKVKLHSKKYLEKLKESPSYKIKDRLRRSFKRWLFKGYKSARTQRLVGCTREEARNWIEAQFLPGMTWGNYGAWHIDHMLPWEHFNLLDEGTHPQVMHYTNLQPLWGPDNSIKGKKVIYDMQWRDTWYIHTGTEYVCRKIQVENKINISVKPIVGSFQGFAHAFMTN